MCPRGTNKFRVFRLDVNTTRVCINYNYENSYSDWSCPEADAMSYWLLSWSRPRATSRITRHFPLNLSEIQSLYPRVGGLSKAIWPHISLLKTIFNHRGVFLLSSHICWSSLKHEHLQANRRFVSPSSHHHLAAKNLENPVLCR